MQNLPDLYFNKLQKLLKSRKYLKEILEEFFNHGIGYLAGLLTYNYLTKFIEVRGIRNLWGFARNKNKMLVSKDTFENLEFIFSAIIGFIIFKIVSHYSAKLWDYFEKHLEDQSSHNQREPKTDF